MNKKLYSKLIFDHSHPGRRAYALPDTEEEAFKEQYNLLRQKRAEAFAQAEQEKQQNLERKLAIIERFKQLADRRDAGIFVHFSDISEKQAKVFVDVDLQNVGGKARKVKVEQRNGMLPTRCSLEVQSQHSVVISTRCSNGRTSPSTSVSTTIGAEKYITLLSVTA